MKKYKLYYIIAGSLFILFSLVELVLCFYGPIVLDIKSTTFIFPMYSPDKGTDIDAIRTSFTEHLSKSRKYMVITEEYAESILIQHDKSLKEITKKPTIPAYAETAKQIGAEKFIMGYVIRNTNDYELFVNIFLTKQKQSVLKKGLNASNPEELIKELPGFITFLDGGEKGYSLPEVLYFYALLFHALFGIFLIIKALIFEDIVPLSEKANKIIELIKFRIPEFLLLYTLLLFIFSYIYALNANMDYVQKFIATGGKLHLAQNTTSERVNAAVRYFPLLGLSCFYFFWIRFRHKEFGLTNVITRDFRVFWALPLTILSALLTSLSLPSFLDINGWPLLGFFCLIPFLLVIEKNSYPASLFYGIIFGMYNTVFTSYWLGTFSLVSLQIVMIIFLYSYAFFMIPAVWVYKRAGKLRFLVFPITWVIFDYLQSIGFTGYPWGMFGVSQYSFLPLIQVSSITGVWGVTFIVVLGNAVLTYCISLILKKKRKGFVLPLSLFGGIFIITLIGGVISMGISTKKQAANNRGAVRIAQIQDSLDPRKHSSFVVLEELFKLTDKALKEKPDLVAWPEGSFDMDYIKYPKAMLVEDLRAYQQKTKTWLLTGTLSYKKDPSRDDTHTEDGDAYNSTMLLTPEGELKQIYHKMHLVPFTEYFPYKKELPWMYKMLKEFDINWWEKGETRVVYEHPLFSFLTPVCYEDVFPGEIAQFIKDGADVIMNLSNDFWSLSPVEGKQHAVLSLFRAVENRRPVLRTTTSGLTCYIDSIGRIKASLPHYETGYQVVDVPLPGKELTFYTMAGDWFPWFLVICFMVLTGLTFVPWIKKKL